MNWHGLLFTGPRDPRRDLARITTAADWNFSGYVLDSVRVDEYNVNWKTFIETYLEVYHVDFYHPGLGNFTNCNQFSVDYGREFSVQIVAAKAGLSKPGTPAYRRWQEALRSRGLRRSVATSTCTMLRVSYDEPLAVP